MFGELLDSLLNKVEGTLGAIVMGMDGISIEKRHSDSGTNIEALAAEYTPLLKASSATTQEMTLGSLDELIVSAGTRIIAVRMITPEYFLLVLLSNDGNIGRARFELRKAKYALRKELVI
jgi:predicted regulator of Ras-like GTPase activity (Roadblock/LC7/MglB family)